MIEKYGSPNKLETRPSRNGLVNEFPGDHLRGSKNGQYIEANEIERSVTIGSDSLDAEMDELEKGSISKRPAGGFAKVVGMHL